MDLVTIYTSYDSVEADLIKAQLEDAGIPNFLKSDNAGGALPHLTMMTGIQVMVRNEDEQQATQIIQDRIDHEGGE